RQGDAVPADGDLVRRCGHHLEVRLRVQGRRAAADRCPQRGDRRPRAGAGAVPAGRPGEHDLPHPRARLDRGRVRDGDPVRLDQGGARGHHRGCAARRRVPVAAVLADHDPEHPALAGRGADDDLDRHPEDLRHHPHDDRCEVRHPGAGEPHVRPVVHLRQQRPRLRDGRVHLPAGGAAGHLQHPADGQEPGGAGMTAAVTDVDSSTQAADAAMGGGPRGSAATSARRRLGNRIGSAIALVIAVLWTVPTFGLFLSSLRPERQIKGTGWWTIFANPGLTLENYEQVLGGSSSTNLSQYFMNSLVICIPATLLPLALAIMAAYAFSVLEWRGRDVVFVGVFALQIVPLQMALIPLLRFFNDTGAGSVLLYLPLWIAHTIFALPLAIFLLHNFMSEVPRDLVEAARIDGAGHVAVFFRIMLPLMMPAIAS